MNKEESTKIVNFMTPGHKLYCENTLFLLKSSSLLPGTIRQTEGIIMMSKEGATKVINFMTPRAGILMLWCGHISDIVKMHYFFKNLLFTQA